MRTHLHPKLELKCWAIFTGVIGLLELMTLLISVPGMSGGLSALSFEPSASEPSVGDVNYEFDDTDCYS